ncbi:sugar transferase [Blastococcus sp. SYSU DS1024]
MRHSRFLHRALAHPPGGPVHRRASACTRSADSEPGTRPTAHRSSGELAPRPTRRGLSDVDPAAPVLTGLGIAVCLFTLVSDPGTPRLHWLVLGSLLLAAGALARLPNAAGRSLAALVAVALLPALLLIALVVWLSGPGPVLVRQDRRGADGRPYPALQFRTTAGSPAPEARTTRVGQLLRALRLDELPALLDIARGGSPVRLGWR